MKQSWWSDPCVWDQWDVDWERVGFLTVTKEVHRVGAFEVRSPDFLLWLVSTSRQGVLIIVRLRRGSALKRVLDATEGNDMGQGLPKARHTSVPRLAPNWSIPSPRGRFKQP